MDTFPQIKDLDEHPLPEIAPSIEEIILSKCKSLTSVEKQKFGDFLAGIAKAKRNNKVIGNSKLEVKFEAYSKCQSEQLVKLQLAAWGRVNETSVSSHMLSTFCGAADWRLPKICAEQTYE